AREVGAARLLWHRESSRQLRDKAPFEQFRATRGKSAALTRTVTLRSLDEAWTGFVLRWNKEGETPASACCRSVRLLTFCCPSVHAQLKAASCRVIKVTEAVLFTMKKDAYAVAGTTSHDQMTPTDQETPQRSDGSVAVRSTAACTRGCRFRARILVVQDPVGGMPKISHDIPSDAGPLGRMGESQTLGGRCDSAASDRLLRRLEYLEREKKICVISDVDKMKRGTVSRVCGGSR
ncbi:hypothetical protein F443_01395, partial [Phytophthora nicotianae P1569]